MGVHEGGVGVYQAISSSGVVRDVFGEFCFEC